MSIAALTFATPLGALAALAGLLPLAAAAVATGRSTRAAQALGLEPTRRGTLLTPVLPAVAACVCIGLAAAQPGLRTTHHRQIRSQSEIEYVVDVSRSMAASGSPGGMSRIGRARSIVLRLQEANSDVPSGVAGLTDRVLPYVFPTPDPSVFAATVRSSVRVEAPAPQEVSANATSFAALTALAGNEFFDHSAKRRTCVLVTDGESQSYSTAAVADALGGERGCRFVAVRVGGANERVYDGDGVPEPGYAPDPTAAGKLDSLARTLGGRSFGESDLAGAAAAVRTDSQVGPVAAAPVRTTVRALAPWLALAGLLLTVLFAAVRLGRVRNSLRSTQARR